ncbi:Uncharacterized protein Rs2_39258 [Raphanus sativus]|nr:Uncharacterized protein Rs2_39258 [Raphanus sativus]
MDLLPAFSKSDNVKQPNAMEWYTPQHNESEEEDDFQSSVIHNFSEEGEDYSNQSYYSDQSYDVSSEDGDSYEQTYDNIEGLPPIPSPIPDEQKEMILTMADIFRNMFQGGNTKRSYRCFS